MHGKVRPVMIFSRNSHTVLSQRTKGAICFLCLFDGLKTFSIRQLARKPRTICQKPLITFDPSFFAPSSTKALNQEYINSLGVSVEIFVDPSITDVSSILKMKCIPSNPPQRMVLHYYGHGCLPPTQDGNLFFFSDNKNSYQIIHISNFIKQCSCPLCLIFDCPQAGNLYQHLLNQNDFFAFFSCNSNEELPISIDAPMDLFSSCLLSPYQTAIWFHARQHLSFFDSFSNDEHNLDFNNYSNFSNFSNFSNIERNKTNNNFPFNENFNNNYNHFGSNIKFNFNNNYTNNFNQFNQFNNFNNFNSNFNNNVFD